MKDYNKKKELPYLQYQDVDNLYRWGILPNLPVNNFGWIKYIFQFNEGFIKNYNEESNEGYFLKVDTQYLQNLHELPYDFPSLPERIKIEIVGKLAANLHDKTEYVVHIRNSRQALNHE